MKSNRMMRGEITDYDRPEAEFSIFDIDQTLVAAKSAKIVQTGEPVFI